MGEQLFFDRLHLDKSVRRELRAVLEEAIDRVEREWFVSIEVWKDTRTEHEFVKRVVPRVEVLRGMRVE